MNDEPKTEEEKEPEGLRKRGPRIRPNPFTGTRADEVRKRLEEERESEQREEGGGTEREKE